MSTSWQGNSHGQQYDKDGLPVNNPGAGSNNYYAAFAQPQNQQYAQPHQQPQAQPNYGQPQPQYGQVQPYNQFQQQPMGAPKNKIVAALLFFFLGELGIGNFYMGQTNLGIAKLVLFFIGMLTMIIFLGFFILGALWLWSLVEMVMVLTGAGGYDRDSNGVPLQ
ncbi:TM2 domain-containing protein [Corynebacterium urinipleomorphum]|uniref:TM2 domain-containing protein n=1 Tax=Corynebacterium urinipleomorphum TaxID=1852380 RepID=UPI000B34DFFE|nr:TM2 domain-containing protein [Corynebacterium urinipleomorphum]